LRGAVVFQDVTERRKAETALRQSEARFRQFGNASSDMLWIRDAETLQWEYLSPGFETSYGEAPRKWRPSAWYLWSPSYSTAPAISLPWCVPLSAIRWPPAPARTASSCGSTTV